MPLLTNTTTKEEPSGRPTPLSIVTDGRGDSEASGIVASHVGRSRHRSVSHRRMDRTHCDWARSGHVVQGDYGSSHRARAGESHYIPHRSVIGSLQSWLDTAIAAAGLGITVGGLIFRWYRSLRSMLRILAKDVAALRKEVRASRRETRKVEQHAQWAAGLAIEALAARPEGRRWYDPRRERPDDGRSDGEGY